MAIVTTHSITLTARTIAQREATYSYQRAMRSCLFLAAERGLLDSVGMVICDKLPESVRLAGLLQYAYAIRYSELHHLDLCLIAEGKSSVVLQPKTLRSRVLPPLPCWSWDYFRFASVPDRIMFASREYYIDTIGDCIPREVAMALHGCEDKTHVFRHLRASWLVWRGASNAEIQSFFGHGSRETADSYIHENLFPLFSQIERR